MDFEIYFSDLNEDAQKRLLEAAHLNVPEDANWDIFSLAEISMDIEEDEYEG